MSSTPSENNNSFEHTVRVINSQGLHARPADLLVRCADDFESQIHLQKGSEKVDCRSILSLLTLGATEGTDLRVFVQGDDAVDALKAICSLFECGFHELDPAAPIPASSSSPSSSSTSSSSPSPVQSDGHVSR